MEPIVVTWREILLVGAIVVFVYIAEAVLFLLKMKRASPPPRSQALDDALLRIDGLESALAAITLRLDELLSRPPAMPMQADPPSPKNDPPAAEPGGGSAYSRAIDLARQGVDADSLSTNCGISRGEAELIIALHRFDST